MNPRIQLEEMVERWVEAGLIDAQTGSRLLTFEAGQEKRATLRWPVFLAMAFGGILLAAGITLFVAAHWSELSPAFRFSLVLLMVGVFHVGGALLTDRFPPLATTLHAVGTATLGAAIFLAAQIFNLNENWATGILLWAIGAACGYILLRDWFQAGAVALLVPAWLIGQWAISTEWHSGGDRPLAVGLILTAICYLSARIGDQANTARRTLVWIGGIALLPCIGIAAAITTREGLYSQNSERSLLPMGTLIIFWAVAIGGPLILAWLLRGRAAWMNLLWAVWAYALILSASHSTSFANREYHQNLRFTLLIYSLDAIGSVALVAWGIQEKRKERINLGIVAFALSVISFYFDNFMDKLGRSASLLILGLLCIAGGYALEITRRKLVARMEMNQ